MMKKPQLNFPFCAITGQKTFKLALILAEINPAIGGVLIAGPRGMAKSTLARGFADTLETNSHFVTLPLSATEEMLVGTLDLQKILTEKNLEFSPGILSKVNNGVLYVDEVNLLADNLIDLLLDVSASGINHIERDGISHSHESRFLLLGTMNPDEGELRPQLLDRFGLSVTLLDKFSIQERVEIVKQREAFDTNPMQFIENYETQQQALKNSMALAKRSLKTIQCSDHIRHLIAESCDKADVDGLRADIVWYRAALAHAAWLQRSEISEQDVYAVEELVLGHRRKNISESDSHNAKDDNGKDNNRKGDNEAENRDSKDQGNNSASNSSLNQRFKRPDMSNQRQSDMPNNETNQGPKQGPKQGSDRENSNENQGSGKNTDEISDKGTHKESSQYSGDWGSMPSQQQRTAENVSFIIDSSHRSLKNKALVTHQDSDCADWVSKNTEGKTTGGNRSGKKRSTRTDWFKTLSRSMGQWPPKSLYYKKAKQGQSVLNLVLLDTSASILKNKQFAKAKSAVMLISEQAYLRREQLSIFGFGNQKVELLIPKKRAPKELRNWLDTITAAGGTPLREVLLQAVNYQQHLQRKSPSLLIKTFLITDGRMTQDLAGIKMQGKKMLIDVESSNVKRGKGEQIATQLGAEYHLLST